MIHTRAILPSILRFAVLLYLVCQMLISFLSMLIGMTVIGMELESVQQPPDPPWTTTLLFGMVGLGSAILCRGLFIRTLWGARCRLLVLAAVTNTILCINPIIRIYEMGNTSWSAHVTYGFPFLMNALILGVVLSPRLAAYIFPPRLEHQYE